MRLLLMAVLAAVLLFGGSPDKVAPAINEVPPWEMVGQQPYEFTWTQRREHPQTLVDFEDLGGWTLEMYSGARGELRLSREQQMWGRYVAKFLYSGTSEESRVVGRPPEPIPIPGRFDSIELWGYGNRWSYRPDETTPAADVSILLMDARGKEFTIPLTDIRWKQWWLIHRKLPADVARQIVWPARFAGIEIAKGSNSDPRYFFCDSLAFYTEELKPLKFAAQPKRNLKPFRGQIVGLNTGPGTLPFPTREETILPSNFEKKFQVKVRQMESNQ